MATAAALTRLPAHEMSVRLRTGEISSVELLEAHLREIAATDTAIHAWLAVDEVPARAAAEVAGESLGAEVEFVGGSGEEEQVSTEEIRREDEQEAANSTDDVVGFHRLDGLDGRPAELGG